MFLLNIRSHWSLEHQEQHYWPCCEVSYRPTERASWNGWSLFPQHPHYHHRSGQFNYHIFRRLWDELRANESASPRLHTPIYWPPADISELNDARESSLQIWPTKLSTIDYGKFGRCPSSNCLSSVHVPTEIDPLIWQTTIWSSAGTWQNHYCWSQLLHCTR